MANELVPKPNVELLQSSGVPALLDRIRPSWQAKNLINRVRLLLEVDPSSACQRLLNAAIHDLREKIIVAGLDIAIEAARQHRLPPISKIEDMETYSTSKVIDLAYRMGLLTRPEWRRVCRCYEIRRDLEHEDDEYEAGVEDCVYIFSTCIEVILSKDPVQLLKVTDIKEIVETASAVVPEEELIEDYERAPTPRQEQIYGFLINVALDKGQSDIVQQNAFAFLSYLLPITRRQVLLKIGTTLQQKVGREGLDWRHARVAAAAGILPYIRQSARKKYFASLFSQLNQIGTRWTAHQKHGDVLRSFFEVGAFEACPEIPRRKILKWLVLTYLGEPGGQTNYGNVRHVYYSNTAAPLIEQIVTTNAMVIRNELRDLATDRDVKNVRTNRHISRRFEKLIDLVEDD